MKRATPAAALMVTVLCCAPWFPSSRPALAAASAADVEEATAKLLDSSDGADWAGYGRTFGEQHYSPLEDIDASNVGRLKLAWYTDLEPGNSTTAPIAVDGVIYFARAYSVVTAVDATTGKVLWTYDPKVPEQAGPRLRALWGSRGIAWWDGKVYTGTADGRLIAVDARTGQELWSAMTVEPGDGRYISGAPRVFDGKVVIGHGGADVSAIRGYVTAYDAQSGKQLWRFFTVPGNPADGPDGAASDPVMPTIAKTWAGRWWEYGGGGTVWNAMTYDAQTGTLLLGTGNGAPWNRRVRSADQGDNLFLCSIVALDGATGTYKWHYQINPGETWDYNAAMDIHLADLTIDGQVRKVAMTAPKNGFFYVIDRLTGKLISAEPFASVTWASKIDLTTGRPVEAPEARYPHGKTFLLRPSPTGAHNWPPSAYNPKSALAYIPIIDLVARFNDQGIDVDTWKRMDGIRLDAAARFEYVLDGSIPGTGTSALLAWDPRRQKEVWRVATSSYWGGGVLTTAGGLVFQGQVDGTFNAYAAATGERLWRFDAQNALAAPPISYRAAGRQQITVITGLGTVGALFGPLLEQYPLDYRTQKRRVLTFVLDGTGQLPPAPPPLQPTVPPDPTFQADASSARRGMITYGTRCALCHGFDMVAGGNAPDLRYSAVPLDEKAFATIVRDGALVALGMPKFDDVGDADREDLRQYIRTRRRE